MPRNFWAGKRVLVTGAGGFIGSHLAEYLHNKGAVVIGTTRRVKTPHKYIIACDITKYALLSKLFASNSFDVCFHLAADSLVESGQINPYKTIKNNLLGALNILELCRLKNVSRIVVASSVHVYGKSNGLLHEENFVRPTRPYETSKACVDLLSQSYADSFHLPVLIPRFVNIYGPKDLNFTRIIPKTIQNVLCNKNPLLWGGSVRREYLYIDDALKAFEALAQVSDKQIGANRVFNFGTGDVISVKNLMSKILKLANSKNSIHQIQTGRVDEITEQRVSSDKAKRVLGWAPRVTLDHGLEMTIDWYKRNLTMDKSHN